MNQYVGQTKTPLAKEWRLVAKGDNPMEVAKKTTALAAKGETMARVMRVSLSLIHISEPTRPY